MFLVCGALRVLFDETPHNKGCQALRLKRLTWERWEEVSKQTGSKGFRGLGLQKWAMVGVSTKSDQERDACRARGQEFKIGTCFAALQTKITGLPYGKDTKEKLGTKLISGVNTRDAQCGSTKVFYPATSSENGVLFSSFFKTENLA